MTDEINQRERAINFCRELAIPENEQILRVIVYALDQWSAYWIPVEERLPHTNWFGMFWATSAGTNGAIEIGYFRLDDHIKWETERSDNYNMPIKYAAGEVTHWRELPKPPGADLREYTSPPNEQESDLCPFCGGEANLDSMDVTSSDDDEKHYYYRCVSCAAEGGWGRSPASAQRMWNMRVRGKVGDASPRTQESHLEAAKKLRPAIFDGLNAVFNESQWAVIERGMAYFAELMESEKSQDEMRPDPAQKPCKYCGIVAPTPDEFCHKRYSEEG